MTTHGMIEPPLRTPDLEDELTAVLCAAIRWGGSAISSDEYVAAKQRFRAAVNAAIEADRKSYQETIGAYEAAMADHRRLVRELDVLLNGDGAAEQASLCDIVAQVRREGIKIAEPVKVPSDAEIGQILKEVLHNSRYGAHQWELWLEFASALFTRYGGGTP